jgi:hypothetical protein
MADTVPARLLAAIKARKFSTAAKLFASPLDFHAWTPTGYWTATDPQTAGRIIEAWFTPGAPPSTIVWSQETSGARGAATLEFEMAWKAPPDDQPRVLRQAYLMTIKGDKITHARIYCAGLHIEFPEVDLEKQRRQKGLSAAPAAKPTTPPKTMTARAS